MRLLRRLYEQITEQHRIDSVVMFDGESDSLVVSDEDGLGDPVEDAVSIAAFSSLDNVPQRILICVGLAADRYNHLCDGTSLRATAELTRAGGYLVRLGLEPAKVGYRFYRGCIEHIYAGQRFQSTVAGMIRAAVEGYQGGREVPPMLGRKLRTSDAF